MVCLFYIKFKIILLLVSSAHALFPASFKWCSATAAHQVEGNNTKSDWWYFESIPGNIKNNDRSGMAVNHWNLLQEDIQRMKALGLNSYRFSIEWAKIQPAQDEWDRKALNHYKMMASELRKAGIEPLVTLHHFTLPQWLALKGGWASPESIPAFTEYSKRVFEALKDDVSTWVTFNEPMVLITAGYLEGSFPPKLKEDFPSALKALKNILTAHGEVVAQLRILDVAKKARFGVAHHLRVFDPVHSFNPLDYFMTKHLDKIWNWSFPEALATGRFKLSIPLQASVDAEIPKLAGSQDFFGINYYTRDMVGFSFSPPYFKRSNKENRPLSDLAWEIYPQGLGILLREIHRRYPALPILITENGIADSADKNRIEYIKNHLAEVERALEQQIPVESYCYWSLMDNFEWAEGFAPRFGLYEVDYANFNRTLRKSGLFLKEVIGNKTVISTSAK